MTNTSRYASAQEYLDSQFVRHISIPPRTRLVYSNDTRVWLLGAGFERLHSFVNRLCDLAYKRSSIIPPDESENRCYDTISEIVFPQYETDFYPPDGFESVFVEFADTIPSPFGNLGVRDGATDFNRSIKIFLGRIESNPNHGRGNVSQTKSPRLRKSKLVKKWGILVHHKFIDRRPTLDFSFALTANDISGQSEYSPNYKGLLEMLDLDVVYGEGRYHTANGKSIDTLATVERALDKRNESIVNEWIYEEYWQESTKSWRPAVDVRVKTGWFSSKVERMNLPKQPGIQRPPEI